MGKNKNKKKSGQGVIIKLHRNYGYLSTNSFGQEDEWLPFSITESMIKNENGVELIEYSEKVSFEINKGERLRDRDINEAINLKFDVHNLITELRVKSKPYLSQVREKFKSFNILLPTSEELRSEIPDINEIIGKELKNEDDLLYEFLKSKGFHPYMLDYLVNGLFLKNEILDISEKLDSQKERIQFSVDTLVSIDKIDKIFREKILKWTLDLENAYKTLMSRIGSQELGGGVIAERVVKHWAESTDSLKQSQYKRATMRTKYLEYSDQYDYVKNRFIPIEDLLDQLDVTSLESILSTFDTVSKRPVNIDGKEIIGIYPWIRDIVKYKEILRDLRVIRNAAAHGRPIIPSMVNPDFNPNWDSEFDNPTERTKIKKWVLYDSFVIYNKKIGIPDENIPQIMQTVFGNPYRKAWFELNFIYHRFIMMFDVKRYMDFCDESQYFLDYEQRESRTEEERKMNPILFELGDTVLTEKTNIPPAYRLIANEAFISYEVAMIHQQINLPEIKTDLLKNI